MAALQVAAPSGPRSDAEYIFRENQADAIIRVVSYYFEEYHHYVIWFPPSVHAVYCPSIATPFPRARTTGLGHLLDRLPLELLHDVLLRLDMRSLFRFRQVNLGTRDTVDTLWEYRLVVSHGLNLYRAVLRTELSVSVPLMDFYDALCTKDCAVCGKFGGFVSLLTWTRCCYGCLKPGGPRETQMQSLASARKRFHLKKADSDKLKTLKTLPGTYMTGNFKYCTRVTIVSAQEVAVLVSGREQGRPRSASSNMGRDYYQDKYNFMGACALPYYDGRTGRVEHGMSCSGCRLAIEKATASFGKDGLKGWGPWQGGGEQYTRDGLLEHFKWCKLAQQLWKTSDEGTKLPPLLPESCRIRNYFDDGRE